MSEWVEVVEEGRVQYIHEKFGIVVKAGDKFVAQMPFVKVFSFGPFDSPEEAQKTLENKTEFNAEVDKAVDIFNQQLLDNK